MCGIVAPERLRGRVLGLQNAIWLHDPADVTYPDHLMLRLGVAFVIGLLCLIGAQRIQLHRNTPVGQLHRHRVGPGRTHGKLARRRIRFAIPDGWRWR